MNRIYLLISLLCAVPILAQEFNTTINNCAPGIGIAAIDDAICNTLETEINNQLTEASLGDEIDINRFAEGSANAQFASTIGQGIDYTKSFRLFYLAASAGVGLDGSTDDPTGVGLGASATIGFNASLLPIKKLWFIDFSRLKLFANIGSLSIDRSISGIQLDGDTSTYGIHGRYELIRPRGISLLGWRGVSIGFGISRSKFDVNAQREIDSISESVEEQGQIFTAQTQDTIVDLNLDTEITSLNLEVASGFRVAYFLSVYGGLGAHLIDGRTNATLNGSTTIEAVPEGGGFSDASDLDADVEANLSGRGDADSFALRGFLGVQINVPLFSLFVQANQIIGDDTISAQFGLKFAL